MEGTRQKEKDRAEFFFLVPGFLGFSPIASGTLANSSQSSKARSASSVVLHEAFFVSPKTVRRSPVGKDESIGTCSDSERKL